MRGGSISAAGAALAVSAIVWHFGSPAWTVHQMRAAAAARDAAALTTHVDFPALRASLEAELRAAPAPGAPPPEAVIDALASPAGVGRMLLADTGRGDLAADGFEIDRQGFSTFRATGATDAGALVFQRQGYLWKLAGVDLPPGALAALR